MQGKVEICGVNTAKLPVLKAAETRALIEKAQQGDMEAREKLINGNLRLVLSVIQKFSGRGESMDDLFQVGVIGLIKAVDCFDLSQKVQFSTYGVPMIAGELRRFLRDHSAIRVSRSMRDTAYRVLQSKEKLTAQTGREPDVEEIAKDLGLPRQEVVFAMDAIVDPGERLRHGPDRGYEKHRRAVAGADSPGGGHTPSEPEGEAHPGVALLRRAHPDGGGQGGGHLPGPGVPSGEKRHKRDQKKYIGIKGAPCPFLFLPVR